MLRAEFQCCAEDIACHGENAVSGGAKRAFPRAGHTLCPNRLVIVSVCKSAQPLPDCVQPPLLLTSEALLVVVRFLSQVLSALSAEPIPSVRKTSLKSLLRTCMHTRI